MSEQSADESKKPLPVSEAKPLLPSDNIEQTYHSQIGDVRGLTGTQQAGVRLAWSVGAAIVLVTAYVMFSWYQMLPQVHPPLNASRDTLDTFKELRDNAFDESAKMFDLVISKALLPVFTAILGYIFGSREDKKTASDG